MAKSKGKNPEQKSVPSTPAVMGRPTLYDPKYCALLIDHMSQGLSFESFAGVIDVARSTLYEWEKEQQDFSDAKKRGTDKSLLFWEQLGNSGAAGHLPGFNAAAFCFNMKNRFRWTDRQDVTSGGNPLPPPPQVVITLPKNGREQKK